jgi:hypothetical protein
MKSLQKKLPDSNTPCRTENGLASLFGELEGDGVRGLVMGNAEGVSITSPSAVFSVETYLELG